MDDDGPSASSTASFASLCSAGGVVLLCILPFCNICGFLWCYTALPLHFVDSGWPLWQLSLLLTLCYIPRVICVALTVRYGDWLVVPVSGIAAVLNLFLLLRPDSVTAVCVSITATCSALNPPAFRSLAFRRFAGSGQWQTQRATRIFTLADTFGYACAPFIGGLLYDNGGIPACAAFATATCSMCMLLPLTLREWRQSFAEARAGKATTTTTTTNNNNNTTTTTTSTKKAESVQSVDMHPADALIISRIEQGAVAVVMLAVFTNICVYAVEWCLYALYFRIEHGWSGSWCGFAQMVGDLLGALVLGLSTHAKVAGAAKRWEPPRAVRALLRPPFCVALLLGGHGALMVMLAQRHFLVSLTGQVLMGTVYVFCEQALQEMLLHYSHGGSARYRRLVFMHYVVFTAGCALCSPIAYGLYGASGFESAFYSSAAIALAVGAVVASFFACRSSRVCVESAVRPPSPPPAPPPSRLPLPAQSSPASPPPSPPTPSPSELTPVTTARSSSSTLCNVEGVVLLCLLPFLNIVGFCHVYTALPLHVYDQGWPLWHLSVILSVCFVPRLLLAALVTRWGDWFALCVCGGCFALSLLMALMPTRLDIVYIGVFSSCAAVSTTTYRGLVYERYGQGTWQLQRALRWFTLFDTLGYSSGHFVGGALYDLGGFAACGAFQAFTQLACCLLPLALPDMRRSVLCRCSEHRKRNKEPAAEDCQAVAPGGSSSLAPPAPSALPANAPAGFMMSAPVVAVVLAAFANICVYGFEWCLYALYFRSMYAWSGAATGAAQMAGDLLGGLALAASTLQGCVGLAAGTCGRLPRAATAVLRPPFSVAALLASHGILMAMLAQPQFAIACTAQVLMGTVYVFGEQAVQEMLVLYAFGDLHAYKRLVLLHYVFFCAGGALCAPLSITIYEAIGFRATFHVAAAAAGVLATAFTMFFAARLAQTSGGLFGGLLDAETELRRAAAVRQGRGGRAAAAPAPAVYASSHRKVVPVEA